MGQEECSGGGGGVWQQVKYEDESKWNTTGEQVEEREENQKEEGSMEVDEGFVEVEMEDGREEMVWKEVEECLKKVDWS